MNLKITNNENVKPAFQLSRFITKNKLSYSQSNHDDCQSEGEYRLENLIGQGQFAQVRVCRHRETGQRFAMKIYSKSKLDNKVSNIKREISILEQLNHQNIVKLHKTFEDQKNQIYIVLNYVSSMNLAQFIQNRKLQDAQIKIIFSQLMSAISYLHSRSIYHRDIKLENILYGQQIALIDFGFAVQTDKFCQLSCGTPNYMSPEILNKQSYNPQAADIWSCGVLLHYLIQQEFLKNHKPNIQGVNPTFVRILKSCLEINPEKRWNAERVLHELSSLVI